MIDRLSTRDADTYDKHRGYDAKCLFVIKIEELKVNYYTTREGALAYCCKEKRISQEGKEERSKPSYSHLPSSSMSREVSSLSSPAQQRRYSSRRLEEIKPRNPTAGITENTKFSPLALVEEETVTPEGAEGEGLEVGPGSSLYGNKGIRAFVSHMISTDMHNFLELFESFLIRVSVRV